MRGPAVLPRDPGTPELPTARDRFDELVLAVVSDIEERWQAHLGLVTRWSLSGAEALTLLGEPPRGCVGSQLAAMCFSMRAQAAMVTGACEVWTRTRSS